MRDGWIISKLSEVADRKTLRNHEKIDLVFTVSAQKGLITQEEYFTKRVASSNLTNYYVVQPGDYVFNKSYSVDAPFGVIAQNRGTKPGLVSPLYIVFSANKEIIDQEFLGLALTSSIFWESLEGSLKEGGRGHGALNLKVADFFDTLVPLPPLLEQKRIVHLISSVDSYIDALQNQLINAKSSRNAVLNDLLNKVGDDWKNTTLGDILTISRNRVDPARLAPDTELTHWSIPQLDQTGGPRIETASEIGSHKFSVPKDSVLYSLLNPRIPRYAKINGGENVVCSTEFAVLQPHPSLDLEFLSYFVSSPHFQQQVRSLAKGTTKSRERIDGKEIAKLDISLPPISKQHRIIGIVSKLDIYVNAIEINLTRSRNLRSGLLSDLLSGEHQIPASYDKVMGAE